MIPSVGRLAHLCPARIGATRDNCARWEISTSMYQKVPLSYTSPVRV